MEPVDIGQAEHYTWGGNCDGWHLLKTTGLSVIQERVPPGGAETAHYHRHAQQFFYVLAGAATLEIGDRRVTLRAGQGIAVPAGQPHRLVNETDAELSFLVVSAPMAHGDRVPA